MSFETAIQTAIFGRLSEYAPLAAVLAEHGSVDGPAIYDDVPQAAQAEDSDAYPFVTIGSDTHASWDTDNSTGAESTITIDSWSRFRGRSEIKTIQGLIYDALHRHELQPAGLNLVTIEWEFSESIMDADGRTRHGVQRFRIITEN